MRQDTLEISYYTNPGPGFLPEPSPFLEMIPPKLVEWKVSTHMAEDEDTLQSIRKMVSKYSHGQQSMLLFDQTVLPGNGDQIQKKAKHPHYGEEIVIDEDESIVVVRFEGFGDKQFMKMFHEVEISE